MKVWSTCTLFQRSSKLHSHEVVLSEAVARAAAVECRTCMYVVTMPGLSAPGRTASIRQRAGRELLVSRAGLANVQRV